MRIALVVHKFPPTSIGGTEIYTQNLARELSRRGHQVFVFYRHDEGQGWEEREGFLARRVSRATSEGRSSPLAQFLDTFFNLDIERAFGEFLDEVQPDLVHFQHLMSLSYRLIGRAKRGGLPTLLTLHDYWFLCSNSQLIWPDARICQGKAWGLNCARCALARLGTASQPLRLAVAPLLQLRDTLVRRAALRADRLIAPSRFLIQRYLEAGFPSERLVYLENGIDTERIRRHPHQPSPDGRLRFAYIGSLAWQKGVHILVEAFRGLPPEKAVLRIYGDPTVFPEYAARLRRSADRRNTTFEGPVPNKEVGRILAETDVVVVPSLWYENSPVVIQEAFAAGVPVIAARVGALTEKISHNVNGLLFTRGDVAALRETLRDLVDQPERIRHLREGIPPVEGIGLHVENLQKIYREVAR